MNLKSINYLLISTASMFIMSGCGNQDTSNNKIEASSIGHIQSLPEYISTENIKTNSKASISTYSSKVSSKITTSYADNGTTNGWRIYDNAPEGASFSNVYDEAKDSRVIKIDSSDIDNGFVLDFWTHESQWDQLQGRILQWTMNYDEEYVIYVHLNTAKGERYLYYTPSDYNYGFNVYYNVSYIHHGLGTNSNDGTWKPFTRDLDADLKEFESDNSIISVNGFFVRGSGKLDDITLRKPNMGIEEAINTWLTDNNKALNSIREITTSNDKTRTVLSANRLAPYTSATLILDTSDLNNIQLLATQPYYRYYYPIEYKIKENDYILVASSSNIVIYDYHTGEELSTIRPENFWAYPINYFHITDDYIVYSIVPNNIHPDLSRERAILQKVDFTNRSEPTITDLYVPAEREKIKYQLAPDQYTIIVIDAEDNHFIANIRP